VSQLRSSHRRAFSTLSLLAAGASLAAACTLDLAGQGTGGGGTTTSTSSAGGSVMVCTPSTEVEPCYGGFTETEGKGICKGGQHTCNADGSGFGDCIGEVLPEMADDCAKSIDRTCDGKLSCPCTPKDTKPCYDGMPAGTMGVGICKSGMRTCSDDGKGFGDCIGQVKPAPEDCLTPEDENCDGLLNGLAGGCVCEPMTPADCTTAQLGECAKGIKVCAADGKSYGACTATLPTFENCITMQDEDCDGTTGAACVGSTSFAGADGATASDRSIFGVASDAAGNIFLGGVSGFYQGANYGVTTGTANITKLDKDGKGVWEKNYTTTLGGFSVVRGATVDKMNNVLLIGEYRGAINSDGVLLPSSTNSSIDVFVVKLDANGTPLWAKSFNAAEDQYGASISAAANGDVFIVGSMYGTMSFGSKTLTTKGSIDVFVARLDAATGEPKWSQSFGTSGLQYGRHIAATSDGHLAVVGEFEDDIGFDGGFLGNKGKKDIFLAKLDGNDGTQKWAKAFGDGADQMGYGVAADTLGNIVITGYLEGKVDVGGVSLNAGGNGKGDLLVASFASDGTPNWSKSFGDSDNAQIGRDVAVDAAGNVLVTGYFSGALQIGTTSLSTSGGTAPDVFVAKLNASDGALGWARSFGDMDDQIAWTITTDPQANVIFGGVFRSTISFAPPAALSFMSPGNYDSFWAKLAP
jgi:hypothetical protein